MSQAVHLPQTEIRRAARIALALGVLALAGCAIGGFFYPAQFFRAYLAAFVFWCGIALGSMTLLMIYCLTGGGWGYLTRRPLEAAMRTLPIVALLFIPIAFGLSYLYLWARPEVVEHDDQLQNIRGYLNPIGFWIRAAVYFVGWNLFAWGLAAWSRRQQPAEGTLRGPETWAGFGLLFYGVSLHFAAVDWIMSLQPTFHSSIFGPLTASSQLLTAMAVAALVVGWLARRPPLAEVVSGRVLIDVGNLLFAFLIIWAYMVFFQYMLIWIGNLRVDVVWYVPRSRDGWQYVAWGICGLGFVVPFFLLLQRPIKQNPVALGRVAALILLGQLAYYFYQVMPAFENTTLADHWLDFLTPVAIGGLWAAVFLWQLNRYSLVAHDELARRVALHERKVEAAEHELEQATAHV